MYITYFMRLGESARLFVFVVVGRFSLLRFRLLPLFRQGMMRLVARRLLLLRLLRLLLLLLLLLSAVVETLLFTVQGDGQLTAEGQANEVETARVRFTYS